MRLKATLVGWLAVVLTVWLPFSAPWGEVAADTKHDLTADPAGFLAGALHAYTDTFTLGQLQNQAYGYLFPQGPFFLLTNFLPDWVAQRLWWTLVLSVGYFGMVALLRRVTPASGAWLALGGIAYALSPRALTTLTAISSETWPVMLAPWVIVPLLGSGARITWRNLAAAVVPVALIGAVNATATLAACVPAALVLVWRRPVWQGLKCLAIWFIGCAAVSLWWLGPLVLLGRYAPPFTEFIESSFVTTRWLNLAEVLRGTTSWTPFVETERVAGTALATEPVFVLLTMAVAAAGLAGIATRRVPEVWSAMLVVGVVILSLHAGWYLAALDGPLAPFRNVHKFDPLVRLPLVIGMVTLGSRLGLPRDWLRPRPRQAAGMILAIVVALSAAPAFNGQLLPRGTYEKVPGYWQEAADFVNDNAAGTRTLIYPPASFARQEWGWTRDEPAQALLDVPWAVRDSIPLIPPEAIRGMDGVTAVLEHDPKAGARALRRLGIGAVLLRHDLDDHVAAADDIDAADLPGTVHHFGEIDVVLLDDSPSITIGPADPVRVAGGGESLALLDALDGAQPRELVDRDADIVTDTPMLVDRNYGTLHGPVSAPVAPTEKTRVHNRLRDYPSAGPRTAVEERGGSVGASSSAADVDSFAGADPAHSVTAATDGDPDTAWEPAPGDKHPWLELRGDFTAPKLTVRATADATVTVRSRDASVDVELAEGEEKTVSVPGGDTDAVRVELDGDKRVGLAEVGVVGHPIERVVTVPDTSPGVKQFAFQRLFVDTGNLVREFTAPRQMRVVARTAGEVSLDGAPLADGDVIDLPPGAHRVDGSAEWVTLTEEGWSLESGYVDSDGSVEPADTDRLLTTGRAFNPGLEGFLDGERLEPRAIDAATQAFVVPAGQGGEFTMSFAADGAYRGWLFGGGVLAGIVTLACAVLGRWGSADRRRVWPSRGFTVCTLLLLVVASPVAAIAGVGGLIARRWVTPVVLSPVLCGIAGAMLARAPWPSAGYAGDSWAIAALCGAALVVAVAPLPPCGHR